MVPVTVAGLDKGRERHALPSPGQGTTPGPSSEPFFVASPSAMIGTSRAGRAGLTGIRVEIKPERRQ